MRPSLLDPLFAPAIALDGVGPKIAELIGRVVPANLGDRHARVGDLLFVMPTGVIDRRSRPGIAAAPPGAIVTLDITIDRHQPPPRGNKSVPYRVFAFDETGEIALTFFHANGQWLERLLPVGEVMVVSGRMEWFNGRPSIVHPDHMAPASDAASLPLIEPIHPLTAGLHAKSLRRAIEQAVTRVPALPEWLDAELMRRQSLPAFSQALSRVHTPKDPVDADPNGAAWRRLAYDELLAGQLALALTRMKLRKRAGRALVGDGTFTRAVRTALPYHLTGSQERALVEIEADMAKPDCMLRLLQGDVGAGKTVVALLAAARAAEAGGQTAIMAPTEILARQHLATIAPLARAAGLNLAILTGADKGRDRGQTLGGIESGDIDIVVGTHALFQESVRFHDLALAVVDEQHRFGVHQRLAITAKGSAPDMLVMTATPIPRTMVLAAFGDMDVSRLTEKPAGRQPIKTVTVPFERLEDLVERIRDVVAQGQKAYWVCPLVEESEEIDLTAATERHKALHAMLGNRVGLVHGRLNAKDKDAAMQAFKSGVTQVLVATTVIEVGVDVPDATIIVIEHAERFGLAQLHQLRGRVGRGSEPSTCVLLYKGPLGETATRRMSVLRDTEDGFAIAEEDLKLRGEGELMGTRQSGTPGFQIALLNHHADLLEIARDDARLILSRDPDLQTPRGMALRLLLYLFGRDDAVRLLRAG